MKLMKLDSPYEYYDNKEMWDNNSEVVCYVDTHIREVVEPKNQVAMLIEPRSIQRDVYLTAKQKAPLFKYIFTHDSKLLKEIPNAKPIIWGGCWCECKNPIKDKFMSILSSDKKYAELHRTRLRTALRYKDNEDVDVYGTCVGKYVDPLEAHEHYKYAIIIENYIDDLWFTEKIINCFATKTIPIYLGSPKISEYFNGEGIIQVKDEKELINTIDNMILNKEYWENYYNDINIQKAIEDNYKTYPKYTNFEKRLYKTYEKEIQELFI